MPERYLLTVPLLIILHIFAGVASAGVGLVTSTIGLKLVPQDRATSYLSSVSLSLNIGAGTGPVLGGLLADFFARRQFSLILSWTDPGHAMQFSALYLTGFSFLFLIAFFLGLLTLSLLANLREEGEVSRAEVLDSLVSPMRELYRPLGSFVPNHPAYQAIYKYFYMNKQTFIFELKWRYQIQKWKN